VTSGFAPCPGSRHVFESMPELINLGLVRKHNAEPGQRAKPRRAIPETCIYVVATLDNGITIVLRAAPSGCMLQGSQRPQAIFRGAL